MHYTFPLGDQANWQQSINCSDLALSWLQDSASLTAKLKALNSDFSLTLLGQGWLADNNQQTYLAREVLLNSGGKAVVYAHTRIPQASLTGENHFLSQLETKPLGEAIFQQRDLVRSLIEYAEFSAVSTVGVVAQNWRSEKRATPMDNLFGRRSTFLVNQQPIFVSEIFLPDSPLYL